MPAASPCEPLPHLQDAYRYNIFKQNVQRIWKANLQAGALVSHGGPLLLPSSIRCPLPISSTLEVNLLP